jgi:hypothetical protein
MITLPTPNDGNCLFHSLASFFNRPDISHRVMRRMLVHYIVQNPDTFRDDVAAEGYANVEDYCRHMAQEGQWGDSIVISAFTLLFRVNVCICFSDRPDAGPPTMLSNLPPPAPTLALLLNKNHYTRILSWETPA